MIKRRKFFQYAGLGSVGLALSTATPSLASTRADTSLPLAVGTPLKTFEYDTMTVAGDGRIKQRQSLKGQFFAESFSKELLEMVAITAATSSPRRGRRSPFFISKYPVTQSQWSAVAALPKVKRELALTPAHFHGSNLPVESVSWLEAVEFCDRLTLHTGRQYQLPSEAQWEYACRAGTKTPFHTGETITSELADYVSTYRYKAEPAGRYRQSTLPVGKFLPNAFGLHDMHGNVWEWCADSWHTAHRYAPQKGRAWVVSQQATQQVIQQVTQQVTQQAIQRAIRGGSWSDTPEKLRSASRSGYVETGLNRTIGFRVVAI